MYFIFLFLIGDFSRIRGLDDYWSRCRWSTLSGEPILYVKSGENQLNIIDPEKQQLILKDSVQHDTSMLWNHVTFLIFWSTLAIKNILSHNHLLDYNWNLLYPIKHLLIGWIYWIDVCPTDANLLAFGGDDFKIKINDRRDFKVVKIFNNIHSGKIIFYTNSLINPIHLKIY